MKNIFSTLLLLLPISVFGQSAIPLSLNDAKDYANGHNLTLANAQLDIEKAQKKIWETTASGLPQLSASAQWQYTITDIPTIEMAPGQSISVGVRNNLNASASLDQLIFNGSYIVGLRASKVYKSLATLGAEKGRIEIEAAVSQAYYLALLSDESDKILTQNIDLIEKTLNEMKKMNEQGFVDRTSVDRIEVAYNQLLAQSNSIKRQVKTTRDMIKFLIGMPMENKILLTDNLIDIIEQIPQSYLHLDGFDADVHIDVQLAQTDVKVSELTKKLYQSEWMPSLGAKLMFSHNFIMPQLSFQKASNAYLGVGLNVPIFASGGTKAKVDQAKLALQQSINKELLARQQLDLEFQNANNEFKLSWDNFTLQKQNTALAGKVLNDTKKSLREGVSSSNDLIQANNSYLEAVVSYLQSQLNLLNAKVRLDKVLSKE